jgi:succinate-semialdehyde dehydrogenase / glutarate-semialdehyde dehydrogenase
MEKPIYTELALLIDGRWLIETAAGGEPVLDPATGSVLGTLPHAGAHELDLALNAAARAFDGWRRTAPYDRAKVLRRAADLIRARLDRIATVLTLEEGKVLAEAKGEVAAAADFIEWFAEEGRRAYGRIIPARSKSIRQEMVQEPVGPVACFTPWNFPAVTPARKIGPALAAGCSCILKPAEETPGTAIELARCFLDAGLPPGVLNVVFGKPAEVSAYLLASPLIRKISFTGSTAVGQRLARLAVEGLKRTTMELGGHAPVIVCRDADPAVAAEVAGGGKFRNAGQVCIAPTRFFVEAPVYDAFVDRLAAYAAGCTVGSGLDPASTMGPLANQRRVVAVEAFATDAIDKGARLVEGGRRQANAGFFFAPTVLAEVPDTAAAMVQEPFGPLALVQRVPDLGEAIRLANSLPYALAAYAFTQSARTAAILKEEVAAGVIGINHLAVTLPETPFGGIKESGHGQEGGVEGLEAYMNRKYITHLHG